MKILIVDDEKIISDILKELLMPYGKCDTAINGKIAYEKVKIGQEKKEPYDLIISDINMPIMDGIDLLKSVRKLEENYRYKFIVMSGDIEENDRKKPFKKECDAYLSKPFNYVAIKNVIEEVTV